MGKLRIKNLLLRSYVGFNPHEIGKRQDLMFNITIDYRSGEEELSDKPEDALDYRTITKEIIDKVENSQFNLLEALARMVLDTIMAHERVQAAEVEIDKLHALRFSESVSISLAATK
ncbi:FolB domain-containing protein [Carboxylicivirga marina]|uniref:Dihydroneopterin triphosphate 2'-epimerase n=1 Tax=Carboxylicivirga marina TaxID=2800988 RepID=A0ABS1HIE8_9BACT|nr:FolB domain-containing protein [Carboxylicivirga marina]MBK3517391.1 FolB domain-containing protein [Carboxylicivirga marina]